MKSKLYSIIVCFLPIIINENKCSIISKYNPEKRIPLESFAFYLS
jgi:hypothetical protein